MGRQIRFFLLPSDVDRLVDDLGKTVGVQVFAARSDSALAVRIHGSTSQRSSIAAAGFSAYERAYLLPKSSPPPTLHFIGGEDPRWLVDTDGEVVEFDGCDYHSDFLVEGRLYYQIDLLNATKDAIIPKSADFVAWSEAMFRRVKRMCRFSKELNAYIGPDAAAWRVAGGQFLHSFSPIRRLMMTRPTNGLLQ